MVTHDSHYVLYNDDNDNNDVNDIYDTYDSNDYNDVISVDHTVEFQSVLNPSK